MTQELSSSVVAARMERGRRELSSAVVAAKMERERQESQSACLAEHQEKPTPPDPVSTEDDPPASDGAPIVSLHDQDQETGPTSQSSVEELMFALYQTQKQMLELLQERLGPIRAVEDLAWSNAAPKNNGCAAFPPASSRKNVLRFDADSELTPFLETPFDMCSATLSPDGRFIAYQSDETGRDEVHVRPYPDIHGRRTTISTDGGNQPVWSDDGQELFFGDGSKMMVVQVETEPVFAASTPRPVLAGRHSSTGFQDESPQCDVTSVGERVCVIESEEASTIAQLNDVLNWFEERERPVSTDN